MYSRYSEVTDACTLDILRYAPVQLRQRFGIFSRLIPPELLLMNSELWSDCLGFDLIFNFPSLIPLISFGFFRGNDYTVTRLGCGLV